MIMKIEKKNTKRVVKASSRNASLKRRVMADEEIMEQEIDEIPEEDETVVEIDPEATELVFEAEDVAELVAEVTGEEVSVSVDTDQVVFTVGEDEYTVAPDGDEEILETSRKALRGKRSVKASKSFASRRVGRPIRRA